MGRLLELLALRGGCFGRGVGGFWSAADTGNSRSQTRAQTDAGTVGHGFHEAVHGLGTLILCSLIPASLIREYFTSAGASIPMRSEPPYLPKQFFLGIPPPAWCTPVRVPTV